MIWNRSEIRRARQTPLKPVLERLGYRLNPMANDNYVIIGVSPDIVVKDHYWVCADTGDAGNAIDFFVRIKGTSFQEAMRLLTS
jgi:hypothetical protein